MLGIVLNANAMFVNIHHMAYPEVLVRVILYIPYTHYCYNNYIYPNHGKIRIIWNNLHNDEFWQKANLVVYDTNNI